MQLITKSQLATILSDIRNEIPICYSKKRVAGNNQVPYFMHSKSACMPGQPEKFMSSTFTLREAASNEVRLQRVFKREKYIQSKIPYGKGYNHDLNQLFTYKKFSPYDDTSLQIAIQASYKQVFGNFRPMESEREIDAERRLRNGDLPIREFIRCLAKSTFYKSNYFEKVNQKECIKLNLKHLLGRPLNNFNEFISNINLIKSEGFEGHVDAIIDSIEYQQAFGEDSVPYQRYWDSPIGAKTSSFINTAGYEKGFATSDNVIYKRNFN